MRHRWIPIGIVAATGGWWVWHGEDAGYHTVMHFVGVVLGVFLVATWFLVFGAKSRRLRWGVFVAVLGGMAGFFVVFRPVYNGGVGVHRWRFRFAPPADATLKRERAAGAIADWQPTANDYPRFLGSGYWAEARGVELETDWKAHPPREVWRREIGAGWSAFSIVGKYALTQEQRGEEECVTCYEVPTGALVWRHADQARFDPSDALSGLGDVGPRATPTVHGERVVTQGGTGIVNCLEARTGRKVWSHDTTKEFGVPVVTWGKAGSPLVVDDLVVIQVGAIPTAAGKNADGNEARQVRAEGRGEVAAGVAEARGPALGEQGETSLVAYDLETGELRWHAGRRRASYSSPVLATLAGERQIVVVNESWVTGHQVSDGKVLWEFPWANEHDDTASCPQPVPLDGDRVFLTKGYGVGSALISISRDEKGAFSATPVWSPAIKKVMKSTFSNVLLREGYVYGLDHVVLECIRLDTGEVQWKRRRSPAFGHGQVLLVGGTIVVLSETGELALVEATPEEYRELASLQALDERNITWNNPAFSAPYLLIRNAREAVCYELAVRGVGG
ncbi:MAG: PQQ-binding-like beta-propeller repeat protein [Pirellulales bacterium]|nr:PQQ-binding-like beta-propeller repeat protein [Pirellulales bacterium]